ESKLGAIGQRLDDHAIDGLCLDHLAQRLAGLAEAVVSAVRAAGGLRRVDLEVALDLPCQEVHLRRHVGSGFDERDGSQQHDAQQANGLAHEISPDWKAWRDRCAALLAKVYYGILRGALDRRRGSQVVLWVACHAVAS